MSSSTLRFLAQQLRRHRRAIGSRWRRLSAGRRALLALAHLRVGHTYAQLAAGFGVGVTTAYLYVAEAIDLLADLAPALADAARTASTKAFVLLDGTLLPIDRLAADRPYYSGCEYGCAVPTRGLTRILAGPWCLVFDLSATAFVQAVPTLRPASSER